MTKFLHIAWQEMAYHLRQWTFYFTAVGMPLIFAAVGAWPQVQAATQETPLAKVETIFNQSDALKGAVGYVDRAGLIEVVPREEAAHLRAFTHESEATAALRNGDIESYYVIAADYVQSGQVTQYSPAPQLLTESDGAIQRLLRDNLLRKLDSPTLAARLTAPVKLTRHGPPPPAFSFIPANLDTGQLISAGLVLLLFAYLLNIGGILLLRAFQREARARVLEVLVVSTTPAQLVGGKIAGLATLALAQAGLTLLIIMLVYGHNPDGSGPAALPGTALALSLPYLLLGYLAYCGVMMTVAAIWPNLPESVSLLALARLVALSPVIGVLFILPHPTGSPAVWLSLCPLTSPLLMPFRLLLGPVPWDQWGMGLVSLLLWAAFWIWLSTRLFRAHGLLTGRSITPRAVWTALRA
ncbi:MAG: ABC transporter permease [Anaerolineae bacterium]|nr:ABC transporter permease [Anaerolineae bacterium]